MQMKVESHLTPQARREVSVTVSTPVPAPEALARLVEAIPGTFVCLSIAVFGVVTAWITPHSARIWYDPSVQYLISSLSSFRGREYAYVDHPGTPVEVLGTLLLGLSYPALHAAREGFVSHYLTHPQDFLNVAQTLVVCASIIVALLLARWSVAITTCSDALLGAGIAVLYFVVLLDGQYDLPAQTVPLSAGLRTLSMWGHESFCFPAGTLLSLAVLMAVRRSGVPSWRTVVGLGAASGVLTSVQLYFAAWVLGTAVALGTAALLRGGSWLRAAWSVLMVGVMAGVGFVVATLPIRDHYAQFVSWTWSIVSHQGIYGAGASGVSAELMGSNLVGLILGGQALFVVCLVGIRLLGWRLWRTRRERAANATEWAAAAGLLAQMLALLVLVAKHPGLRYLLPLAAMLPLVFAAALDKVNTFPQRMREVLAALGLAALVVFGVNVWSASVSYAAEADWLRRMDAATETMLVRLAEERHVPRASLRTLWTYGTNSPCYALRLGDEYAEHTFQDDIGQICPHDGLAYVSDGRTLVSTDAGSIELADYQDWDVLVLTDGWVSTSLPVARPPGSRSYTSSIETIRGLGKLVFVTRAVQGSSPESHDVDTRNNRQ